MRIELYIWVFRFNVPCTRVSRFPKRPDGSLVDQTGTTH